MMTDNFAIALRECYAAAAAQGKQIRVRDERDRGLGFLVTELPTITSQQAKVIARAWPGGQLELEQPAVDMLFAELKVGRR